jgi:hypothetical protein
MSPPYRLLVIGREANDLALAAQYGLRGMAAAFAGTRPARVGVSMTMHRLLSVPMLVLPLTAAQAETPTVRATAQSSIIVETNGDDWTIHERSVRFQAYLQPPADITYRVPFLRRLAEITTVSDGMIDDQAHRIEVTINDMSGPALRPIARFSDPGIEGKLLESGYFVTTEPGCCERPPRHHVRNTETGTWLFDSSGGFDVGMAAWMGVPNHHPTLERWAAFEASPGDDADPALLGTLRYGDNDHAIDTFELRMEPARQPQDFRSDFPTCGALVWHERGKEPGAGQLHRPAEGKCYEGGTYFPSSLFSLEHQTGLLGGFDLELSVYGKVYGTIPIAADRLDLAHAKLEQGMRLVPARR